MITHSQFHSSRMAIGTVLAVASVLALTACGGEDTLALGESADVEFADASGGDAVSSGTVTVTAVREGSAAELEDGGFTLDPEEQASSVYYVDITYENDGDAAIEPHGPDGEDPDGNTIGALTVIDLGGPPFDTCAGVPDEVPAGQTAEGCSILLVPEGWDLDRISFFPGSPDSDFIYWETGL